MDSSVISLEEGDSVSVSGTCEVRESGAQKVVDNTIFQSVDDVIPLIDNFCAIIRRDKDACDEGIIAGSTSQSSLGNIEYKEMCVWKES